MPNVKNETLPALGREAFNILMVLASGFAVERDTGAWRVMLPPASPGGSTAVADTTIAHLATTGLVILAGDRAAITIAGRRVVTDELREANAEALVWVTKPSSAGMERS